VLLRTTSELRNVITKNPFSRRKGIDPSKLLITFLDVDPGAAMRDKLPAIKSAPEELCILGRELYIYFPNGMARPKLSMSRIERVLQISLTSRNLNTAQKLLAIAKELEARK